jgi:PPP family 3-phenylpropionic acid transporter
VPHLLVRQALFYALLCAGTGATLPFMPLWLRQNGMSSNEIAWILAVPLIGRAVTGPLSGIWADRFARYRTPIAILALVATLSYAGLGLAAGWPAWRFAAFLALYGVGYTGITNITPLLDAMTLQLSRVERFAFGLARAAGSASFVFANVCLGFLLQGVGTNAALFWMILTALMTCVGARFLLPSHIRLDLKLGLSSTPAPGLQRLGTLLGRRGYIVLLIAVGCLQAAHSYYYAFSTIIWQKQGLSSDICGLLWATGVAGEFAFLSLGARLRRRLGPWTLLLIGAASGVARWSLMACSPPLEALWALQLLHGLSFGAVYVAGLELVHLLVPPGFEGLGQTINSAYAGGALIGLGTIASGAIFDAAGQHGYVYMTGLSLAGTAAALWLYARRRRLVSDTRQ